MCSSDLLDRLCHADPGTARRRQYEIRATFLLDAAAQAQGLLVATGFCGHGFAMGPIVGRLMAEWIVDGQPSLDLSAFRLQRFFDGTMQRPRSML